MPILNVDILSLESQRLEGTITAKLLARQLTVSESHVWTLSVNVVSNEGHIIANLLQTTEGQTQQIGTHFELTLGPLMLSPVDIQSGHRISISIDAPTLEVSTESGSGVKFSQILTFLPPTSHPTQRLIGQCIYCFTRKNPLSKEHVIPLGLTLTNDHVGHLLLLKASCVLCARITSRFELDTLRCALIGPRIALGSQTRRKKQRPTKFPLWLIYQGGRKKVMVPADECPLFLIPLVLAVPAHLSGDPYTSGVKVSKVEPIQISGLPLAQLAEKYGGEFDIANMLIDFSPVMFAKLIGKIAYGYAVLLLGLDAISNTYILPDIRGEISDIGRWVGSVEGDSIGSNEGLHALTLKIADNNEIHVFVRLFAQFNLREYVVIVGKIKKEYVVIAGLPKKK